MSMREESTEPEVDDETAGEECEESTGRMPMVILSVIGAVGTWRAVTTFPEVAYVVVGSLGTIGVLKVQAWRAGREDDEERQEQEETAPPDVAAALRRLVGDDKGVLLTALQKELRLPDTKAVKQLLDAEGIPWKAGRTRAGNGPSVRREDIPPAPSPAVDHSHGDGCCCRSGNNANSNNDGGEGGEEGFRVEHTDTGFTIHDLGRRVSADQAGAEADVIARFIDELTRAQHKPPGPPTS